MSDEFQSASSFLYVSNIERQVLGAAISSQDTLQFVLEHMKPEYFYDRLHTEIMQLFIDITTESKQIDLLVIIERLRKSKSLLSTGLNYVADMASAFYTMRSQLSEHCDIIKQYYFRRRVVEINQKYALSQMEQESDPIECYNNQQQELLDLHQQMLTERVDSIANISASLRQEIDNAANGIVSQNITPTGLKALDNIIIGLFPTDLILIGARPSMGKTALALSIIMHFCQQGKAVKFYSLEMPKNQIVARLVAMLSGVSYEHVKRARLDTQQQQLMLNAVETISKWKLYIDDRAGLSPIALRSSSQQDSAQGKNIDLIVVDYIQLMGVGSFEGNRNVGVGIASSTLKIMAKDLQVPVIALSQLNRSVESRAGGDKRPILADLRDSGSLEQDADMIMFLFRAEQYGVTMYEGGGDLSTIGIAELNVAKNRNGELGLAMLNFKKEITLFTDLEAKMQAGSVYQVFIDDNEGENPF